MRGMEEKTKTTIIQSLGLGLSRVQSVLGLLNFEFRVSGLRGWGWSVAWAPLSQYEEPLVRHLDVCLPGALPATRQS